ncbi:MAG: hypothetical protein ACO3K3_03910 [Schleiferiaceae bacterium]
MRHQIPAEERYTILLRLTLRHNNIAGYIDNGNGNMSSTFTK